MHRFASRKTCTRTSGSREDAVRALAQRLAEGVGDRVLHLERDEVDALHRRLDRVGLDLEGALDAEVGGQGTRLAPS